MTTLTIESLGISKEDLIERVVERIAESVLNTIVPDDDGNGVSVKSQFAAILERKALERVNDAIEKIAAKNILPNVAGYVEGLVLQETNKWGEKTGKAVTFTEYLVKRAEHYLVEEVNYEGKTKEEGGYGWSKAQTRISQLVNKHLHYSIENAMKDALKVANSAIANGIEKTVKIKLAEITEALRVKVETR